MRLARAWERFWFQPQETLTIGVVRSMIGLLLLCWCLLLAPAVSMWFTNSGIVPLDSASSFDGPGHFSLLFFFPSVQAAYAVFSILMLCALLITVGLYSRLSCICAYLCLLSFHHRDLVILNSGDTMLKMMVFFLCLAPAGASFSLDALRRKARDGDHAGTGTSQGSRWFWDELVCGCPGRMAAPWAQRLIQVQISLVYMSTFLWKVPGLSWRTGYAMYIVGNLSEMQRFPLPPLFHTNFFVNLQTWFGLLAEFSMGFLVWFPATRLFALLLGCLLHLGIEYTMNIPLFATIMAVSYLTFLNLSELRDRFLMTSLGRAVAARLGHYTDEEYLDAAPAGSAADHVSRHDGVKENGAGGSHAAGRDRYGARPRRVDSHPSRPPAKNGRTGNRPRPAGR